MRRLLIGLITCAVAASVAFADDEKKPAEAFEALEKEFYEKLGKYKDEKERQAFREGFTKKFLAHATRHPKDASSLDAFCWVMRLSGPSKDKDSPFRQALAGIRKNHVESKRIAKAFGILGQCDGQDGADLLAAVVSKNPDRKAQAACVRMMKLARESLGAAAERFRDDKALREDVERSRGKEYVKTIIDNRARYAKEVKDYEKMLADKYAGVFPEVKVGKPAPEVVAESLDGQKVKLSDLKGKVVVLDVWATWCGPCLEMTPHSRKLVAAMKGRPFVFVGASADDKKQTVRDFLKKHEMPWTHWWVGRSEGLMEDWDVE